MLLALSTTLLVQPHAAQAQSVSAEGGSVLRDSQQTATAAAQGAANAVEDAVRRFGIGVSGGIGLDPEIIDIGAHALIGPVFNRNVQFRPGVEAGFGEVTTMFAINLDVLYNVPGFTTDTRWLPYLGAGPTFGLSHRGFETDEGDKVDVTTAGNTTIEDDRNRFDFSDTDFNGGVNFIVGMRRQSGAFFEMRATAWGVSNIRLLAGFNF